MSKAPGKKVWERLLRADLICLAFLLGVICSRQTGQAQKTETTAVQEEIQEKSRQREDDTKDSDTAKDSNTVENRDTAENSNTAETSNAAENSHIGKEMDITEDTKIEKKKVALTFDDGPHPVYTPQMLEGLAKKNVKATFFLLGKQVEKYPDIVKQMSREGHLIGNHSYKHEQLSKLSSVQAGTQINRTNELIQAVTGKYPEYLRPPFGDGKDSLDGEVNMIEVLWDVDTRDWSSKNKSQIINKVVTNVEEGDIILMHDSYESTVSATMEIIDILRKDGYEFVTVDELILE